MRVYRKYSFKERSAAIIIEMDDGRHLPVIDGLTGNVANFSGMPIAELQHISQSVLGNLKVINHVR